MIKQGILYKLVFVFTILTFFSCSHKASKTINQSVSTNSKASLDKPYLFLISLDGFRWDYVERFKPPHLSEFINNGVKAESLIPSFPSKTFPNHYTVATGMYPDNHGLLGNSFYSYEKDMTYKIGNREMVEDGSFYGGTPIWVQATKSGMVTASFFFVGSEADVQGIRPTYYYRFDSSVKKEARVDQALAWLSLPEKKRPHMITMYFEDMDNIGHSVGPNADELLKRDLYQLDEVLGKLFNGIKETGLPVNVIFVSDHGMTEVPVDKYLPIEMIENEDLYHTVNNGSIVNIHPADKDQIDSIFNYLQQQEKHFKVYKTEETPYFEYTPKNKNWGPIQILPDEGYYFITARSWGYKKSSSNKIFGQHGYDPNIKDMHGIFYANGPAFKQGYVVPSVKNIHVYPLMCKILELDVPDDVDGELKYLEEVLQSN